MTTTCKTCQKPLKQPQTGRRREYCSTPCRRAQEAAIARLRAALARLDAQARRYETTGGAWAARTLPLVQAKRAKVAAELAGLTG